MGGNAFWTSKKAASVSNCFSANSSCLVAEAPVQLDSSCLDTKPAKKVLLSDQECQEYLMLLTRAVEDQEAYLNAELTLRSLAADLKLHPNKLSWLLNTSVGKNFNEYINTYRLEAFKRKALSPANSHLTLLGLAYESGFNSKTVFNNFFKKHTQNTPGKYRKSSHV